MGDGFIDVCTGLLNERCNTWRYVASITLISAFRVAGKKKTLSARGNSFCGSRASLR